MEYVLGSVIIGVSIIVATLIVTSSRRKTQHHPVSSSSPPPSPSPSAGFNPNLRFNPDKTYEYWIVVVKGYENFLNHLSKLSQKMEEYSYQKDVDRYVELYSLMTELSKRLKIYPTIYVDQELVRFSHEFSDFLHRGVSLCTRKVQLIIEQAKAKNSAVAKAIIAGRNVINMLARNQLDTQTNILNLRQHLEIDMSQWFAELDSFNSTIGTLSQYLSNQYNREFNMKSGQSVSSDVKKPNEKATAGFIGIVHNEVSEFFSFLKMSSKQYFGQFFKNKAAMPNNLLKIHDPLS